MGGFSVWDTDSTESVSVECRRDLNLKVVGQILPARPNRGSKAQLAIAATQPCEASVFVECSSGPMQARQPFGHSCQFGGLGGTEEVGMAGNQVRLSFQVAVDELLRRQEPAPVAQPGAS
jgi:hypothetical protein